MKKTLTLSSLGFCSSILLQVVNKNNFNLFKTAAIDIRNEGVKCHQLRIFSCHSVELKQSVLSFLILSFRLHRKKNIDCVIFLEALLNIAKQKTIVLDCLEFRQSAL